jgi:hypothetical protein
LTTRSEIAFHLGTAVEFDIYVPSVDGAMAARLFAPADGIETLQPRVVFVVH